MIEIAKIGLCSAFACGIQEVYPARIMNFESLPQYWINRLSFILRKELTIKFRENGFQISPEEWGMLLNLWQQDGWTPTELADQTIRDRTTVTRLIDGMVKKNLVTREIDPDDRRRSLILLTPHGKSIQQQVVPIAQGLIQQSLEGVSPEDIHHVVRVLRQMTQNILEPPT